MKNRIGIFAALALSATGLAACWEDSAPKSKAGEATAKRVDPCSFISAAEVAAITTDKVIRTTANRDTCKYHAEPDDGAEVEIHVGDGVKRMQTMHKTVALLDGIGKKVADKGAVGADTNALLTKDNSAPDLGDEALWAPAGILAVRKGDFYVEVTPPIMHDPANHAGYPLIRRDERRAIALQIAKTILANAAK